LLQTLALTLFFQTHSEGVPLEQDTRNETRIASAAGRKEAVDLLESTGVEIILAPDKKTEIVAPLLKGVRGVLLRTGISFTRDLIAQGSDLWIISRTGAGVDNVDIPAATEKGILVTAVIGANTQTVAEHTLSLILALMKQLPGSTVRCVRIISGFVTRTFHGTWRVRR